MEGEDPREYSRRIARHNKPTPQPTLAERWGNIDPREYSRRQMRLYKYDLTHEEFEVLLEEQDNRCAICEQPFTKTPHVDHDHKTGRRRKLLCYNCNLGLGFFKDEPKILARALVYLEDHRQESLSSEVSHFR